MVIDYSCFGDVVYFDTTYRTNKSCRPFAPFLGFNNHRETVIFGAALLYDETAESFEWLFKTFLKAMCEKKPKTIFTDQDAAMAKAILIVLPESYHRLCTWHLYQNALKNVGHAFKRSNSFASELRSCMYDYEYEDDFLHAWESLLDKHDLRQNKWMQDFFKRREKWASVYGRNTFSASSTSTQLSESFNSRTKGYMSSTFNVLEFFKNFERLLDNLRYKEIDSNYDMSQKTTPLHLDILLLKNAREIYTSTIYALVLKEYEKSCNMLLKECNRVSTLFEYKVCIMGHMREHTVSFNSNDETVECSCKHFESFGILCGHALRVLNHWNKIIIPPKYILKRWTKHARSGCVLDNNGRVIKEDPKLVVSNRFKDLCRTAVEIASRAAETDDATTFFAKKLLELGIEVDKILMKKSSAQNQQGMASNNMIPIDFNKHLEHKDGTSTFENNTVIHVKGMKKKDGVSRVKGRPKSCLEKNLKKKRHSQVSLPSSSNLKKNHTVSFNSNDETVECSCKHFESFGILCGHALRVLNHWNKIIIPPKYILKRWTKHARSGCVLDNNGRVIKEDPKLVVSNRFKDLCRTAVEIASRAAETDDATTFFAKKLLELGIEVDKILMKKSSAQNQQGMASNNMIPIDFNKHLEHKDGTSTFENNTVIHVKGMKKKDGVSRVKGRPKSCLEKNLKKKRHSQVSLPSSSNFGYSDSTSMLALQGSISNQNEG